MNGTSDSPPPRRPGRGGRLSAGLVAALCAGWALPAPATGAPVLGGRGPTYGVRAAVSRGRSEASSGHEDSEGFRLAAAAGETVRRGPGCPHSAPVRRYEVAAIDVDMTLNRYLDHDPQGRMYVLEEDLARVRQEEARNAAARSGLSGPAVSLGLQGDAIQPLTLRVLQGECLRIVLRNAMRGREPATLHLHGSGLHIARTRDPAIATDPKAVVRPGQKVTYEWYVRPGEPEGTHYFHSHGNDRLQSGHGLFGALIVEPTGSEWLDPRTGRPERSGWDAIVRTPHGDFREFALYYHEIGNESYQLLDKAGSFVPLVDPLTGAYRPGARALNYRAEPFMNRLALQQRLMGRYDESVSYSSYAFGDPATPMMRAYLGDPVRQRVIHGGSEVFHVHHVHGGSIRWRRQPGAEDAHAATGLDKHPPLVPKASERIDSQAIGPSEAYDITDECGSGGCQQSVGDFLYHCHVAHHYFAGMWGIWRVYNTLQDGRASTDSLPSLAELPDRRGRVKPAVTSDALVGKTVDWSGQPRPVGDVHGWVEAQLPPRGVPKGYDASVLDWAVDGDTYLGETETDQSWPGYAPRGPGERPPLPFDPRSGKPAYPFLRPHLGRRPPFAPGHGPAPFLDPASSGTDPPPPGANGPGSVCPQGTKPKAFRIDAIAVPITVNRKANVVDPAGEIYVLRQDEDAARASNDLRHPLAIRANAGEDCVDVLLASELEDTPENHGFSKVNAHIHFMQFDVQASDGVITGFNYEQSVRPFADSGERVAATASAGQTAVRLGNADRFQPGALVGVGMDQRDTFEVARVAGVQGATLVLDAPLRFAHGPGEWVSTEFVRYRWYPDVQFGTAYFHDHVNAVVSWRHGLFGAVISEPPGSTYHDPHTGAEIASGPVADVHTDARVSADVTGSFRELAMFLQDDSLVNQVGLSTGSAVNLRAEPVGARGGDPSRLFSSADHGDPETPLPEAYVGDPVVVRVLVGATNDVHTWHLDGHWFRAEPYTARSPPIDTVHVGISERYDLSIPAAGGPQRLPGDYLWYNGRSFKLREGSWGILRVRATGASGDLKPLPGHEGAPPPPSSLCPPRSPHRQFDVAAVDAPLPMLGGDKGKVYVLEADREALLSGHRAPEPLVLHVDVGDCVTVRLSNRTGGPVSFHPDMLALDPDDSGVDAGNDAAQSVPPGHSRPYTFYASPDVGETVSLVRDWGDVVTNPALGLYGAIVVGPSGARYLDPATGGDASRRASWAVDVVPPHGRPWRDFSLFLQDEDPSIGTHRMPYRPEVDGTVGLNYLSAPLSDRLDENADTSAVFRSSVHGDPPTPLLRAFVGDDVRVHVLAPWSEQAHVFTVEGHRWPLTPGLPGTDLLDSVQVGGMEAITMRLDGGAGGVDALPGDYLYGDHREPYREAGMWGIFRVRCARALPHLEPLPRGSRSSPACEGRWARVRIPGVAAAAVVVVGALLWTRRRRRLRASGGSTG